MGLFTAAEVERMSKTTVRVALLAELQFRSGPYYVWSGDRVLKTAGHEWQPLHGMGFVDGIPMLSLGEAESITMTLNGVDHAAMAAAIADTDEVSQRFVLLSLLYFDADWQPIGVPANLYYGFMQPPRVSRTAASGEQGAEQRITVDAVNAWFNRSRPPFGKYTDVDQQRRHPGDKFFSFIASTVSKVVVYPDY